ncbi:GNAT family N-acetyltransferase [Angustibacter sp. McL0619]|uniref:GNAT family N-acetyltransferase n=1 Tax=Angustibacter sp. McL0619 TaxID=3415676 RepID=UPI003CF52E49
MALDVVPVTEQTAALWREIHNRVIAPSPLSLDDVRERLTRNRLTLGYVDGVVVGNATLRPPTSGQRKVTVIVRVLPEHRGRGYGTEYAAWILSEAAALGVDRVETVVLAANDAGLRFALRHGFVEHDRYTVTEGGAEYVDLSLSRSGGHTL